MRNPYKILVRNLEGKRPVGRPRHRWRPILKSSAKVWTGLICLGIETSGGLL
jgi:hypothetical protein